MQWGTNIFMEFGLGWIGDKGAGQIGKVTSLGGSVQLTRFSEHLSPISNPLPLKDRFAFAGGDGLRSRFDTPDFKQAEEKLSTYQFNLLVVEELIVAELMVAMFRIVLIHHLWSTFFTGN